MVDCLELLRARLGEVRREAIASVEVAVYPVALQYDAPDPASDLAARFSFRTTAALALVDGPLRPDSFAPERFGRPEVQAMATRVALVADPALGRLYPQSRPTRVMLSFTDGRRESAEVRVPRGDGPAGLTDAEVRAKAGGLLSHAWGPDRAKAVISLMAGIASGPPDDLPARLGDLLRQPFPPG
jgi:2-methylcitrate dehydratase PrpD